MRTMPNENALLTRLARAKDQITRLPFEDRAGAYSELADMLLDKLRGMTDGEPLVWIAAELDTFIENYHLEG